MQGENKAYRFQILHLYQSFSNDTVAVKGLIIISFSNTLEKAAVYGFYFTQVDTIFTIHTSLIISNLKAIVFEINKVQMQDSIGLGGDMANFLLIKRSAPVHSEIQLYAIYTDIMLE